MCLALYIASANKLPGITWNEDSPAFHVTALADHEQAVTKQFESAYICYVGSAEGCGCGFILGGREGDELVQVRADREKLIDYVRLALSSDPKVQLFGCWEGDQWMEPTKSIVVSLAELSSVEFPMNERILVREVKRDV